jgi:hypothetical protein
MPPPCTRVNSVRKRGGDLVGKLRRPLLVLGEIRQAVPVRPNRQRSTNGSRSQRGGLLSPERGGAHGAEVAQRPTVLFEVTVRCDRSAAVLGFIPGARGCRTVSGRSRRSASTTSVSGVEGISFLLKDLQEFLDAVSGLFDDGSQRFPLEVGIVQGDSDAQAGFVRRVRSDAIEDRPRLQEGYYRLPLIDGPVQPIHGRSISPRAV